MTQDGSLTLGQYLHRCCVPTLIIKHHRSDRKTTEPAYPRTDLAKLRVWQDFPRPSTHLSQHLSKPVVKQPFLQADGRQVKVKGEMRLQGLADRYIHEPVADLMDVIGWDIDLEDTSGNPDVIGSPDRIITRGGEDKEKPLLVIEYKTPWALPMFDLFTEFQGESSRKRKRTRGDDAADKNKKVIKAVHQLYGYMSFNYLRYGVLSNYDRTYFFRRSGIDEPGVLEVYGPVHREATDKTSWFHSSPSSSTPPPRYFKVGLSNGSKNTFLQFKEGVARHRSLVWKGLYGTFIGETKGTLDVLIKAADITQDEDKKEEMENEVKIYGHLKNLQGVIIPKLIASGTIWGMLKVIILQPFGEPVEEPLSAKIKKEMKEVVTKIHEAGVLHGDIARQNFLRGDDGSIKIIDFGFAKLNPKLSEKREELATVESL